MLRTIQGIGLLESKCRSESRKLDLKNEGASSRIFTWMGSAENVRRGTPVPFNDNDNKNDKITNSHSSNKCSQDASGF